MLLYAQQRIDRCAYVPLLADNLLPNADLLPGDQAGMPVGWDRAAGGVELRGPAIATDDAGFVLDDDGRSLQLIGIANYAQTPPIAVRPGQSYCFTGYALTDSEQASPTRLRVAFLWHDAQDRPIAEETTTWQPVVLWQQDDIPEGWSPIRAAFRAPPEAATLLIRLHPASDDRVYLDAMHVRTGGNPEESAEAGVGTEIPVTVEPWPDGHRAALSFSFDWETAMGGLIHSRSVDDPYANDDPEQRGLRMREGITTTLAIFEPYAIRATYYATGYNFLSGNTTRTTFMNDPTYSWANTENRWASDRWETTPWFALDPYGTVQSDPAWYFGDLIPLLQQAEQDIQSHTFSHFYGGLVGPQDWQADIRAWNSVAAAEGVPPMRSLAFPWSSSAGMSDANWFVLEESGITSVTRLSDQAQYNLFPQDADGLVIDPQCRPLPGHERMLACPDFYLTPESVEQALVQLNRAYEVGGMIDLWAHTEEVVTAEQQETWRRVVRYAAEKDDLWIAPLREIADWQQALAAVTIQMQATQRDAPIAGREYVDITEPLVFTVANRSDQTLRGLTLRLPFAARQVQVAGEPFDPSRTAPDTLMLNIPAGEMLEVAAWPAS